MKQTLQQETLGLENNNYQMHDSACYPLLVMTLAWVEMANSRTIVISV